MNMSKKPVAGDIMTKEVVTATPKTPILEASRKMLEGNFSGLPVIDAARKVIGIVTDYDFLTKGTAIHLPTFLKLFGHYPAGREEDLIKGELADIMALTVKDVMNDDPIVIREDASIFELVQIFSQHHRVNPIPVVDGAGELVGIISRYDVIKYYAGLLAEAERRR